MLTLYHMHNALCAQKVRVALAEKQLDWKSEIVPPAQLRSESYLNLNPMGYVPTLVHDGDIVVESRIISEFVDTFEGPSLLPTDRYQRAKVARWMKLIDDTLHFNAFVLTFCVRIREMYLAMDAAEQARRQPMDPIKRAMMQDVVARGVQSELVGAAIRTFQNLLAGMEAALGEQRWLVGNSYTLADSDYTAYIQRLADVGLDCLWSDCKHVSQWFDAIKSRPSFGAVVRDWFTDEQIARDAEYAKYGKEILSAYL
jgi:glutathione S-transferase